MRPSCKSCRSSSSIFRVMATVALLMMAATMAFSNSRRHLRVLGSQELSRHAASVEHGLKQLLAEQVELEKTDPDRKQYLQIHRQLYGETVDSAKAAKAKIQLKMLHLLANSKEGKKALQAWLDSEEEGKKTPDQPSQLELDTRSSFSLQQLKINWLKKKASADAKAHAWMAEAQTGLDGRAQADWAAGRPLNSQLGPHRANEMQSRNARDYSSDSSNNKKDHHNADDIMSSTGEDEAVARAIYELRRLAAGGDALSSRKLKGSLSLAG